MAFVAEYGVIAREVELKTTPKGHKVVEVPVFFNDYIQGVGKTTWEARVTLWGDKAQWLFDQAQKHEKKDGTQTKGKGMPMFFVGNSYTHKYKNNQNVEVRENRVNVFEVSYSEVPTFSATGVIATEVENSMRIVDLKSGGKTTVAEVPVFFNGFYPGMGKGAFETFVTLWGDKAEWLKEQAEKHTKKDGTKTGGKGMAMKFTCFIHTHKYNNQEGNEVRVTKTVAGDVRFPTSVFGSSSTTSSTPQENNATTQETPAAQEQVAPQEAPAENFSLNFELDSSAGSTDILGEFDSFLKEINEEHAS